jgi:hypothetical protein
MLNDVGPVDPDADLNWKASVRPHWYGASRSKRGRLFALAPTKKRRASAAKRYGIDKAEREMFGPT